jgi:hypothetical protein
VRRPLPWPLPNGGVLWQMPPAARWPALSWRKFLVLLHGLGPQSAIVSIQSAKNQPKYDPKTGERVIELEDPKEIEALFRSFARSAPAHT